MSRYVDGFVLPLKKDKIEDYRRIAERAGRPRLISPCSITRRYGKQVESCRSAASR